MRKYIHELSDWADFRWDEARISEPLARVSREQGRLLGRMGSLDFATQEQATVAVLSEDVVETSAIEGERLDPVSVRSSVGKRFGVETGLPETKDRSVDGVVQMLFDATQKSAEPLTVERLWHWHRLLFPTRLIGYDPKLVVGGWRRGAMSVVSGAFGRENVHFRAPDAERVPAEVDRFVHWFNVEPVSFRERLDPIIRSAMAHLWFVTIHPFDDGNGRIARAIADLQLTRGDGTTQRFYSMSRQIKAEQQAYYDALESAQQGTLDITAWLLWYIGCLERAIDNSGTLLDAILKKDAFWRRHDSTTINDRQRRILNRLLDGFEGNMTSKKWAAITKTSVPTAVRDANDLIERGMLRAESPGTKNTHYAIAEPE